jgi:hypothetical protein
MVLSALIAIGSGACADNLEDEPPPSQPVGANRPPTLGTLPDATIAQNTSVTLDLLAGASDPDGDPLTVFSAVPDPALSLPATLSLQADHRHVLVTPAPFSSGEIHIKYTVHDGHHYVNGTVIVVVDRAPMATGDQLAMVQDTVLALTLRVSDPDGDALTFTVVTPPRNGSLTGTAPNLVYIPAPGFVGSDQLSFSVSDGHLTSGVATVVITVVRLNHAPVATPQSIDAVEDTSVIIPPLAGTDADGDPLGASVQTAPAHGTLTGPTSSLTYTPAANYHGPDSFTFVVNDGHAISAPATVSINVASVNDLPVAVAMQRSLNEDTPQSITLLATDDDGDPLSFAIQGLPQHGTLSGTPPNMTYTPAANYNGSDSFTYTASDGVATSAPVTVTLSIAAVNDAPVALDGAVTTAEDTPVAITLQATDVDNTGLTFTVLTVPSDGTLTGSGASRTYTPAPNATGARSFTFRVSDGALSSSTATVTITITPVNDAPVAVDDFVATDPGAPLTIDALHNDTDLDGDSLSIASASAPAHGGVEIVGGHLVYTPDAGFTGVDSFDYTAEDPAGASSTAHVHVGVGQFPDAAPTETILALAVTTSDSRNAASMSSDGRYLAFTTMFGLAAADTNGVSDVYVYDRGTRTVALISQSASGGTGNSVSRNARISADGRYVVFESFANNLVAGDTNSAFDVFRRDRLTGETVRVSVTSGGGQASGSSTDPRVSDDGNLVAFASTAFDLVANDANGASDIFVRDISAGTTTRVSVSTIGGDADLPSTEPAISGDGRVVAFTSAATNLVPGDSNGVSDTFVRDLVAGTTARVSVSSTGGQADKASAGASLSRDGRFISFLSSATNLVTGASGTQVYVRDTQALTTTRPLSSTTASWARLSSDGRYLAALTTSGVSICDRFAGIIATPTGASTWLWPSFSGNGRYLVVVNSPSAGSLVAAPNPL